MAASLDNLSKLSFIFIIAICLFDSCSCQSGAPSNNLSVTSDPSTASTQTTQVTPTPSTISPSTTRTVIQSNTDVSKCPCDLTGLACDVNCCCDPDCSDNDKRVFTFCLSNSYRLDDKLCFDRDVILYENGPKFSNTTDDLFCIYFDNDEERNYYTDPSLVTTEAQFLQYLEDYADFSFQPSSQPTPTAELSNFYRSGDPIYVVFPSQATSFLSLPVALSTSSACTHGNPAAYLIDQTNECVQTVATLGADSCTQTAAFLATSFHENFRVIRDPFLLKYYNSSSTQEDPVLGTLDLSSVTELYDNEFTLPFEVGTPAQCIDSNGAIAPCATQPTAPTWDTTNNVCQNVLTQVHYSFVTVGTFGIQNASVSFVYSDLSTTTLTQTFTASFTTSSDQQEQFQRSGRPGYVVGEPIIAGNLTETVSGGTTEQRIVLDEVRGQQLSLVRPSITGNCLTQTGQTREPVLFGQDMRSGCFIEVALQNNNNDCRLLNEAIITALEGRPLPAYTNQAYESNFRYVSMFGDSSVFRTGDWVEIQYLNRPHPTTTTGQCLLSLGMDIQIIYANVGSLPNPQPKIIAVGFVYDNPQAIEYRCSGPFCLPAAGTRSQKFEITSSVTFIDASQRPEGVEGERPTFAVRLPYDFFYPFLNSAPGVNLSSFCLVLSSTVWAVGRWWFGFR